MTGVMVRLLGPVEVIGPQGPAGLVGVRQRGLVGLLGLSPGVVVARERLIDALWGEDPPRTAVRTLQSHVARVRRALDGAGLPEVLRTKEPGYVLAVGRGEVDACRFEDAVREARRAGPAGAVAGLRAALELWRDDALSDCRLDGWAAREIERLGELRVTALEELWELELRLGRQAAAITELDRLHAGWPSRDKLIGLLMAALHREGRTAEALERYERFRVRLGEELGAAPGPWLRALHTAILRGEAVLEPVRRAYPIPAQLPPPVGHFAGRVGELRELGGPVTLVCGPAGAGKTALAVQWAHGATSTFPDGQIFLDLRGHDPDTALSAEEVLGHALRALGVPDDRLPAETAEQTALFRTLVHDKRMLLLLDNADSVDSVLPLVPSGAGSVLVVTSRRRLAALAVHHAVRVVPVGMLEAADALALVKRIVGAGRVGREHVAAQRLVELCGRLPLALRIAAAKLAARPAARIVELVGELSGGRLDALSLGSGSSSVRAVFASAYRGVGDSAQMLLRSLGLHPGTSVTTDLAAALAGVPLATARRGLEELGAAHLIVELGGGRYQFHDLIRNYAAEIAGESPAAIGRMLDWYLAVAHAANRTLDSGRDRVELAPRFGVPFPPEPAAVLGFLDKEHANLLAVIGYSARHGHDSVVWRLCYLLAGYFASRGHYRDRMVAYRWGLAAAQRLGDPAIEGLMRSGLGVACIAAHRYEQALNHLGHALDLAVACGDRRGEGHVRSNIAVALGELRRFDEAIEAGVAALAVHTANGHQHGITVALNNLGCSYARAGRLEPAVEHLTEGLRLARRDGDTRLEAAILHGLGEAHRQAGNPVQALDFFDAALELRRAQGDRRHEANTLNEIGLAQLDAGLPAADAFQRALELSRALGDPQLEAALLTNLGLATRSRCSPVAPVRG